MKLCLLMMCALCVALSNCSFLELYKRFSSGEAFLDIVLSDKAMFFSLLGEHYSQFTSILLLAGIILKKGTVHQHLTSEEKEKIVSEYEYFDICQYFEQFKADIKGFCEEFSIEDPSLPFKERYSYFGLCFSHHFRVLKYLKSVEHAVMYLRTLDYSEFNEVIAECIAGELLMQPHFDHAYTQGCLDNLLLRSQEFEDYDSLINLFNIFLTPNSSLSEKLSAVTGIQEGHLRLTSQFGSEFPDFLQACIDAKASILTKNITSDYARKNHFLVLRKLSYTQLSELVCIPTSIFNVIVVRYWYIQASFHPSMKSPVLAKYIGDSLVSDDDNYFNVTSTTCPSKPPLDAQHSAADSTDLNSEKSSSGNNSSKTTVPILPDDVLFKIFLLVNEGNLFQIYFVFKNVCKHWNHICRFESGSCLSFPSVFKMLATDFTCSSVDKVLASHPWNVVFKNRKQFCLFLKEFILTNQMSNSFFSISDLVKSFNRNEDLLTPSLLASIYCMYQNDGTSSLLFPDYFTDAQIVETLKIIAIDNNLEIRLSREHKVVWDMLENRNVFDLLMADRKAGLKVLSKLGDNEDYLRALISSADPCKHPLAFLQCILGASIRSKDEIEGHLMEIIAIQMNFFYFSSQYVASKYVVGSIKLLIKFIKKGYQPVLGSFNRVDCTGFFRAVLAAKPSVEDFKLICDLVPQKNVSSEEMLTMICDEMFTVEQDKITATIRSHKGN